MLLCVIDGLCVKVLEGAGLGLHETNNRGISPLIMAAYCLQVRYTQREEHLEREGGGQGGGSFGGPVSITSVGCLARIFLSVAGD